MSPPEEPPVVAAGAPVDAGIAEVVTQLERRLHALGAGQDQRRAFLGTYLRMTATIGQAVAGGVFEDPGWVRRWDVAFVGHFLAAHDADVAGGDVPRPWRLAFAADPALPTLVHLLLDLNAHVNYDLPLAVLAVISDEDFEDAAVMASRHRDHERVDALIASRVAAEGELLPASTRLRRRLLAPLDRWSSRRFLSAARRQVWANAVDLHRARQQGADAYRTRLAELDVLASAKIVDLLRPGPVLLRLALVGFGVRLPPA
ncbi:hypothetical protein SAMN04488543_2026 [Friedmanniella luteola]|uniref:Uncharacterized protein n=1 Tax=Friedmanniella luteola TaxID=546871 RepID=A0A1H1TH82_9ACTN|nr:DUF5995 family protein [Friedmanniella luteola]SDS59675.1 hypothetical protein SAMN04488543_2026 [Friedmanniella luteola]